VVKGGLWSKDGPTLRPRAVDAGESRPALVKTSQTEEGPGGLGGWGGYSLRDSGRSEREASRRIWGSAHLSRALIDQEGARLPSPDSPGSLAVRDPAIPFRRV
jgi:hypothetical protein